MATINFKIVFISGMCLALVMFANCTSSKGGMDLNTENTSAIPKKSEMSTYSSIEDIKYYVDEQINNAMESDDYKSASIDDRKEIINQLLTNLKKENAIIYFSYAKDSYLFSFEYNDGTLGGVKIKDFDTKFNRVPIG